jgi:Uri superfamily endonuclease
MKQMRKKSEEYPFADYAARLISTLELLKHFNLPEKQSWEIDWAACLNNSAGSIKKPWHELEIYRQLLRNKSKPAIYYFSLRKGNPQELHEKFRLFKRESARIRKKEGVGANGFLNLSHVPDYCTSSKYIYAGSTKKNIHHRFLQHLGVGSKGRTGALYLLHVLKLMDVQPVIEFHYHILDRKYVNLTEHIEAVMQDHLKPFIGKRAMKELKEVVDQL